MAVEDKTINLFSTRVRQLLLQYEKLESENRQLKDLLEERGNAIQGLEKQLKSLQNDYNHLVSAKVIEAGEGDLEAAKAKIAQLIRNVNKCITLLSEK